MHKIIAKLLMIKNKNNRNIILFTIYIFFDENLWWNNLSEMIHEKFATTKSVGSDPWEIFDRNSVKKDLWEISIGKCPWEIFDKKYQFETSDENCPSEISHGLFPTDKQICRFIFSYDHSFRQIFVCRKPLISDRFLVIPTDFCHRKNTIFF